MNISAAGIVILLVMVSLTCALVFRNFLFGEEYFIFDDIGSDTAQQYIAQYASIIDHIRSGDFSLWNFDYGFGAGFPELMDKALAARKGELPLLQLAYR